MVVEYERRRNVGKRYIIRDEGEQVFSGIQEGALKFLVSKGWSWRNAYVAVIVAKDAGKCEMETVA